MRTITYGIQHWTDEDTGCGDSFEVIETETRHATTGDEIERHGVASFGTRAEAQAFIDAQWAAFDAPIKEAINSSIDATTIIKGA